jgi:Ser/Thr protein kinase RdoA (MazF antagonist)
MHDSSTGIQRIIVIRISAIQRSKNRYPNGGLVALQLPYAKQAEKARSRQRKQPAWATAADENERRSPPDDPAGRRRYARQAIHQDI